MLPLEILLGGGKEREGEGVAEEALKLSLFLNREYNIKSYYHANNRNKAIKVTV